MTIKLFLINKFERLLEIHFNLINCKLFLRKNLKTLKISREVFSYTSLALRDLNFIFVFNFFLLPTLSLSYSVKSEQLKSEKSFISLFSWRGKKVFAHFCARNCIHTRKNVPIINRTNMRGIFSNISQKAKLINTHFNYEICLWSWLCLAFRMRLFSKRRKRMRV